jgi:hypothetical protein
MEQQNLFSVISKKINESPDLLVGWGQSADPGVI